MFKTVDEVTYYYQWLTPYHREKATIVCLHGFTGTSNTFANLPWSTDFNYLAIDMIGHGKSSVFVHPENYEMTTVIRHLKELLTSLDIPTYFLLGYSMGGRLALAWGIEDSNVQGILLESASPGLAGKDARQQRCEQDDALAQRILLNLPDFVAYWEELPLFSSQKCLSNEKRTNVRSERLSQQSYGLAMSLYMMGTGRQASYWDKLVADKPILAMTGAFDTKFQHISQQMKEKNPKIRVAQISDAGHCIHLEQPQVFVEFVEHWLKEQL
ncbi:2-succinyl-6-hydroxy-2,4-cyclohexadiene-1-carboxylate synthase [Candidatus Enterococcus willemsii]|uniref:Putative 2-succinyl-6-hydroxy-2,4-cyclohexadiene-1-carboxylate synthase n=1 Tax=Candidatus Enterococcus willemsii TaxID=1857215 RepID=A0ABQ6YW17_9ENTE|nr:2-succinyl-6-hydroxy-2,4-cyclohexadiene-1-carboxylate synthase [Enterococcus sp. CU12B]KAF1301529.1 2-succinyl-6-hydroxy-2,4-cyclohexadiene-1-carboxylate synthase [Enterococcus sp. CU12B]